MLAENLAAQGIAPIWMPDNSHFDPRLAGHTDLSFIRRDGHIISSKGQKDTFVKILANRGYAISFTEKSVGVTYPMDAGLCALDTGIYLICNPKTADPAVLRLFSDRVLVPVSQGYTRCAAAVVDEHSIITADAGVSRAAKRAGMDVLDITAGAVKLDGFPEGFIGGASFLLNKNTLAFVGSLDEHPDKARILAFLKQKYVQPLFLAKGSLIDIGGALALP